MSEASERANDSEIESERVIGGERERVNKETRGGNNGYGKRQLGLGSSLFNGIIHIFCTVKDLR